MVYCQINNTMRRSLQQIIPFYLINVNIFFASYCGIIRTEFYNSSTKNVLLIKNILTNKNYNTKQCDTRTK